MFHKKYAFFLTLVVFVTGCAPIPPTGGMGSRDYSRYQAQRAERVEIGTVVSVQAVTIDAGAPGYGSYVAPAIGAAAGFAIGSTIGKGNGKTVARTLGALVGGAAGHVAQRRMHLVPGVRIIVSTKRGQLAVTQSGENIDFRVGDTVRLLAGNDGKTRVIPV